MNKKIDRLNHTIELIVVFIGITAAFMLNNWRDSQAEEMNSKLSSKLNELVKSK